ncbi:MAG: alpha/beta fold hydrolase [Cytophagales bacterium]|nr:MAG: alpha/beta fold hydrolase [Cytophagales bacterium]TAF59760.1 MAG: alpha/beta fold hydrolase [Cytophagales bacterium]
MSFHYQITLNSPQHRRPILLDLTLPVVGQSLPLVILVHGFKGFKDWGAFPSLANYFSEAGFAFAKFNFSHNGTTPAQPSDFVDLEAFGNNNFELELDDLGIVLDKLLNFQLFKVSFVCLIGHSRGGGVALLKAAEDPRVQAVCTWASIADIRMNFDRQDVVEVWKKQGVVYVPNARTNQQMPLYFQLYENTMQNWARFDLEALLPKIKVPILAFHGTEDKAVPLSDAYKIKAAQKNVLLEVIEGADHTFGVKHPLQAEGWPPHFTELANKTLQFFAQLSGSTSRA